MTSRKLYCVFNQISYNHDHEKLQKKQSLFRRESGFVFPHVINIEGKREFLKGKKKSILKLHLIFPFCINT